MLRSLARLWPHARLVSGTSFLESRAAVPLLHTVSFSSHKDARTPDSSPNPHDCATDHLGQSSSKKTHSLARSNFHKDTEQALNKQINHELSAHYTYLAMAVYFDRDDVALPGFSSYFFDKSLEERGHAMICARYLNKRGGRVKLEDIKSPKKCEWKTGLEAMEEALEMEKSVNETLIELHRIGSEHGDPQLTTFVEDNFFQEQTEDIKTLANYVGILRKVGQGLGEFEFDYEILRKQGELKKFTAAAEKKGPNNPVPGP
ncbi:soma ferritin-like [Paramacrobiotus metropolitanus]|uniref:soma ferritin-like n=1 Tax=Paramacrobiotus metropolitanus TaxID=2943436 RepID=UPI0024457CDC|nr:soma ferritin-like [Paramacrobiotus metropolitanus]